MLEFLTLFLGIVAGAQEVQLAADPEVSSVELRLDGRLLGTLTESPWHGEVDLGPKILPHRLEAIGLDSEGSEVGRTSQALNVPRPAAEVALALEHSEGRLTGARVAWESALARRPDGMRVQLDGADVPVLPGDRVDLSGVDEDRPHVLQATLSFTGSPDAQSLILFGGGYIGEARADLTAWPVRLGKGKHKVENMRGWFSDGNEDIRAVAVEKGPASLIIVRSPGVATALRGLSGRPDAYAGRGTGIGPIADRAVASGADRERSSLPLGDDLRARLLVSRSLREMGQQVDYDLFSISPELTERDGGLFWVLTREVAIGGPASRVRVADAVTSAGLQAAASNHRRGVLLVLAEPWEDASRFSVASVREYLSALGVPLVVWRLGRESVVAPQWGDGPSLGEFPELKRAWRDFQKELERQRVVWLEGNHLPNAVELTTRAGATALTSGG